MHSSPWISGPIAIFWLVTLVIAGLALWKGDRGERVAACAIVANFALSMIVRDLYWGGVQVGILMLDFALLAVLVAISLRVTRWWPRAAAGFCLLACLTHPVATLDREIWIVPYLSVQWLTGALLIATLFGALFELPFARRHEAWVFRRTTPFT